jgi:hypothetical protein
MPTLPATGSELSFGKIRKAYTNIDPSPSANLSLSNTLGGYVSHPAGTQISVSLKFGGKTVPYNYNTSGGGGGTLGSLLIVKKSYPSSTTTANFDFNPSLGGGSVTFVGMTTYNSSPTWGPWQLFDDTRSAFDWCNDPSYSGGMGRWDWPRLVTLNTIFIVPRSQGDNFPTSVTVEINGNIIGGYSQTTLTASSGQQINYTGVGFKIELNLTNVYQTKLIFPGPNSYIGEIEFWGS